MADTYTTPPASDDKRVLEEALAGLQGTASQFGAAPVLWVAGPRAARRLGWAFARRPRRHALPRSPSLAACSRLTALKPASALHTHARPVIIVTEPLNLERRAPVWEALSELFVGRELQDYDYAGIAKTLRLSGYSLAEIEKVLREEVAPVFRNNLSALAIPEMEGWAQDTVVKEIRTYLERERTGLSWLLTRLVPSRALPDVATKRWLHIRSLLS